MSALVTLSVMQGCSAAWLGIRWGIGHSTGLILIMLAVLLLKEVYSIQDMVDLVEGGADWVVGLVMLMLGFWGYWKAWRLRRLVDHVSRLPSAAKGSNGDGSDAPLTASRHQAIEITSCEVVERSLPPHTTTAHQASERARPRSHASASLLAVCVGVVHGMGAPGGILAVLPTLLMPGVAASCLYLGAFCASSTLVMGAVAGAYGACTHRAASNSSRLPSILAAVSATFSVLVGVLWLVCSAMGSGTLGRVLESFGLA